MALIGEQFEDGEDICGVVASVRQWQDKLSLWTKTAANEAAQVCCYLVNDNCNCNLIGCSVILSGYDFLW